MGITALWGRVWNAQTMRTASIVAGVVLVFGAGVAVGNGNLRLLPHGNYKSVTGLPSGIDYSSLDGLYDELRENYNGKLTTEQVLDGLKHGLAKSANDPYTEYFTPKEAREFNGRLEGVALTGIGAQLDQNTAGNVVVIAPMDGSPAEAAGIMAQDIIMTIDGQSTADMSLGQAVQKIRGAKGSKVTLQVVRGADQPPLSFTIVRDDISVPTATSKILDDNVGYIRVSQFSKATTYALVQEAVESFKQAGVKKLVLDLRDNPGGEVDSAQDISSLWLSDGAIVMQEKRGNAVVDSYRATGKNPLKGMPTVVLINGGSASASEITALALRDAKAATIIGEKSYGKGVVQQVIPFDDGSQLKVTVAKWYSPKGTNVHHNGIKPDQTVTISDADAQADKDTQLQAAQDYLRAH